MAKRYYLLTLGCPKNTVDAEGMAWLLQTSGWTQTQRADRADVLIVNTCGFIEPARQESLDALRDLARSKHPGQMLLAAGCLSQRWGNSLRRLVPGVDETIGTREWARIVPCVHNLIRTGTHPPVPPPDQVSVVTPMHRRQAGPSAYLKISDGCGASCAFCAIPQIKGPHKSKGCDAILAEVRELADAHVQEIILIGQDTTAYGHDLGEKDGLPGLLEDIHRTAPQIPWLRLMYAYPQHISPRLIEQMAINPQICHYLDLPLQHADPATLRRMRRSSDVEGVRLLIERLRSAMPDVALRTTFIVGFPGETESEFLNLLDFMRSVAFDRVGVFKFSPEEGTVAASFPDPVPAPVAEERYARAMELQRTISLQRNQAQIGRTMKVLVEGSGDGVTLSRSYRDAPEIDGYVILPRELKPGQMVQAKIVEAMDYDLRGDLVER